MRNGSVRINVEEGTDEDEKKSIQRKKTPMPRSRAKKTTMNDEDLDENGIIDRDEDDGMLYNDDDDVSTSTLHGSDYSLEEYIKEENKVNDDKSNGHLANGKMKLKRFVSNIKDKGRGLSCKNADNVITESDPHLNEIHENGKNNPKSCSLM